MKIQIFSQYYNLAMQGRVEFLSCPMHEEDYQIFAVKYALEHKEENNKVMLYCTNCGYKNIPGQQLYENVLKIIERVENDNNSQKLY
jgi:C4-type Zn-finger protein